MSFCDYIVYADESGDHGLINVDPNYPIFVLAFCIFKKTTYSDVVTPALQRFKFKHFGHDMVVLHERDIRKRSGMFVDLADRDFRDRFMTGLSGLVDAAEFTVIASVIQKEELRDAYGWPDSPYDLALAFCLERLYHFLKSTGDLGSTTHVVFEQRGAREDEDLELHFRRVCSGQHQIRRVGNLPFEPIFAPKTANSCGLQLADLVARPIGRHVLDPDQPNRAYEVILRKIRKAPGGGIAGWGLKTFPP